MKPSVTALVFFMLSAPLAGDADGEWVAERREMIVSAYCACSICCEEFADGKTATMRDASLPGVAVDPDVIPLGSRLDIPGYQRDEGKWILADDVGGAIKGNRLDVRFKKHERARAWGRRRLRVRVWRKNRG